MRALIIRPSALGDTLMLVPALYQVAGRISVTLVGRKPGIDFLQPLLTHILDYETGRWHTLFFEKPHCEDLSLTDVDTVISFLSDRSGMLKQGLQKCLKYTPVFSFSPFPKRGEKIHVAAYLASCLQKAGLPCNPGRALDEARKRPLLLRGKASKSESTIVIHPGSGSTKKNYSSEFWINLIRNKDFGVNHTWLILLGPAEQEWDQNILTKPLEKNIRIIHSPYKDTLLSLLKNTSLYIGHDSGITHLAAMLGTRTICLFKNSDPLQWAPLGPHVMVIRRDTPPHVISTKIRAELSKV